jgi:hypothetical protein
MATAGRASEARIGVPARKGLAVDRGSRAKRRKRGVRAAEKANAERVQALELRPSVEGGFERRETGTARLPDEVRVACRRERGQCELFHAVSSFGER